MNFPRMSPRRWFWSIMATSLLWCGIANRNDPDINHPHWMRIVQSGITQPAKIVLVPPTWIATLLQGAATGAITRVTTHPSDNQTGDEIRQRNRDLESENAQLKGMVEDLNRRISALENLRMVKVEPADVVTATIVGGQPGMGIRLLHLDKGSNVGVKVKDAVVAPLQQVCVLGRVTRVSAFECEAHLLTSPDQSARVEIVRPRLRAADQPGVYRNDPVTTEPCLLKGTGDQMRIDDVSITVDVQKKDLVCLADGEWPAKTQHMVIGEVVEVNPRQDQPLRWDIRVNPYVSVLTQRSVMILIKE